MIIILFYFCPYLKTCGILAPWPGIKPLPPVVEALSINPWTAGEVPFWLWFLNLLCSFIIGPLLFHDIDLAGKQGHFSYWLFNILDLTDCFPEEVCKLNPLLYFLSGLEAWLDSESGKRTLQWFWVLILSYHELHVWVLDFWFFFFFSCSFLLSRFLSLARFKIMLYLLSLSNQKKKKKKLRFT